PHDLFLEVWATAGFWALLALLGALGLGFWNLLGPPSRTREREPVGRAGSSARRVSHGSLGPGGPTPPYEGDNPDAPPRRVTWLIAAAGAGWAVVVMLGRLNPFEGDLFFRWLVLGGSWLAAVLLGAPLWRRLSIPAPALGAAALAVVI